VSKGTGLRASGAGTAERSSAPATTLVSPSDALGCVLIELRGTKLTDQSTQRMAELLVRFTIFVEKGVQLRQISQVSPEHARAFVQAAISTPAGMQRPSVATMHLRRSALRLYFRTLRQLDLFCGDPTVDLALPARSSLAMRPLTNDEVALGRSFSLQTLTATRQPAAWALAEATARTSEIPHIVVSDLDLTNGRVWIHGSSKAEARWGLLSDWGATQLARRIGSLKNELMEDPAVAYEGRGSEESAQASSCIAIAETLMRAGIGREPDVRPGSVVAWAGRRIFEESGSIEEVARRLGIRSLDRAARFIGWGWAPQPADGDRA
jgi:site-specific recombinase XerC